VGPDFTNVPWASFEAQAEASQKLTTAYKCLGGGFSIEEWSFLCFLFHDVSWEHIIYRYSF
jgi:hypothetical protein